MSGPLMGEKSKTQLTRGIGTILMPPFKSGRIAQLVEQRTEILVSPVQFWVQATTWGLPLEHRYH